MRKILLFSTSTLHGGEYLEYAAPYLREFLGDIAELLFVPYARPAGVAHDEYTERTREALIQAGVATRGIHEHAGPADAVRDAEAVFIGGGNTFALLSQLYEARLMDVIRERVAHGMRYVGSSAGSNVAGLTIGTTNDMPVVEPPSLEALGLVPFNINPHYLDPDPDSTHMGETREVRIREFHAYNQQPVLALREGALVEVKGAEVLLRGKTGGRLFRKDEDPEDLESGANLDFLLD